MTDGANASGSNDPSPSVTVIAPLDNVFRKVKKLLCNTSSQREE